MAFGLRNRAELAVHWRWLYMQAVAVHVWVEATHRLAAPSRIPRLGQKLPHCPLHLLLQPASPNSFCCEPPLPASGWPSALGDAPNTLCGGEAGRLPQISRVLARKSCSRVVASAPPRASTPRGRGQALVSAGWTGWRQPCRPAARLRVHAAGVPSCQSVSPPLAAAGRRCRMTVEMEHSGENVRRRGWAGDLAAPLRRTAAPAARPQPPAPLSLLRVARCRVHPQRCRLCCCLYAGLRSQRPHHPRIGEQLGVGPNHGHVRVF